MSTDESAPFPVFLATVVGYVIAASLLVFGVIGVAAADQVSDPFGVGILVLGAVVGLATVMLGRGHRVGRAVLAGLAAITFVVAVVYVALMASWLALTRPVVEPPGTAPSLGRVGVAAVTVLVVLGLLDYALRAAMLPFGHPDALYMFEMRARFIVGSSSVGGAGGGGWAAGSCGGGACSRA